MIRQAGLIGIDRILRLTAQFILIVESTKYISPAEFGVYVIPTLIIGMLSNYFNTGLHQLIIQSESISVAEVKSITLTYWSVSSVMFICTLLYFLFFFKSIEFLFVLLLCISLLLSSVISVPSALMMRNNKISSITFISIVGTVVSTGVSIFILQGKFPIYYLVVQSVIPQLILFIFFIFRRVLVFPTIHKIDKSKLSYARYVTFSSLLHTSSDQMSQLILGSLRTTSELSLFIRAYQFMTVCSGLLSDLNTKLLFPKLAHFFRANGLSNKRNIFLKISLSCSIVGVILAISSSYVVHFIVSNVFGEEWGGVSEVYLYLTGALAVLPLNLFLVTWLNLKGLSKLIFKAELIKKLMQICLIIFFSQFHIVYQAFGISVYFLFCLLLNLKLFYDNKNSIFT